MATDPTTLPTIANIQQSKKDMDDINTFTVGTQDNFVDNTGRTRRTIEGINSEFDSMQSGELTAQAVNAADRAALSADVALVNSTVYPDEVTGRVAVADGNYFKVIGSGDVAAYEYQRVNESTSIFITAYPSIEGIPLPTYFVDGQNAPIVSGLSITFTGFSFLYYEDKRLQIPSGTYTFTLPHQFLTIDKSGTVSLKYYTDEALKDCFVIAKTTPDSEVIPNSMLYPISQNEKTKSILDISQGDYIEFLNTGSYNSSGVIDAGLGGYNIEKEITRAGSYSIGWWIGGTSRAVLAVNDNDEIMKVWNGDYFNYRLNRIIHVPEGATKLLLTSYGDNPKNGYLTKIEDASEGERGVIDNEQVSLVSTNDDSEIPYVEVQGYLWSDGNWRFPDGTSRARIYTVDENETYDFYWSNAPTGTDMAFSSKEIIGQLSHMESYGRLDYNGLPVNGIKLDVEQNTINGETFDRFICKSITPPAGTKRVIIQTQYNTVPTDNVRIYKRRGASPQHKNQPRVNSSIVVCGDSVSQNAPSEIGKERLRNEYGCNVETYGVGGSGWAINSYLSGTYTNNVSGVYQIEELVKPTSDVFDIYCLSATVNDPITHQKAIGSLTDCVPYLKIGSDPDLTDPNLDTMLGGLNFSIQRIYEKNPNARIVIATMNKVFLTNTSSGYSLEAGYDPNDTSTNSHGSTYYEYVEAVRSLGNRWGIPIVDIYGESGINELNKSENMFDSYHPKEAGYESMWSLWIDKIINS